MNVHRMKLREKRKKREEANQKYDKDVSLKLFDKQIAELKSVKQTEKITEEIASLLKQRADYIRKYHPTAYKGNRV